jgi:hypothetical protein
VSDVAKVGVHNEYMSSLREANRKGDGEWWGQNGASWAFRVLLSSVFADVDQVADCSWSSVEE